MSVPLGRREMEESLKHSNSSATRTILLLSFVALAAYGTAGVSGLAANPLEAGVHGVGAGRSQEIHVRQWEVDVSEGQRRGREGDLQTLCRLFRSLVEWLVSLLVRFWAMCVTLVRASGDRHGANPRLEFRVPAGTTSSLTRLEPFDMSRPPLAESTRDAAAVVGDLRRRLSHAVRGSNAGPALGMLQGVSPDGRQGTVGSATGRQHSWGSSRASMWAGGPIVALSAAQLVGEVNLRVAPRISPTTRSPVNGQGRWWSFRWWRRGTQRQGEERGNDGAQIGSASIFFRDDRFFGFVEKGLEDKVNKACVEARGWEECVKRGGDLLKCWESIWNATRLETEDERATRTHAGGTRVSSHSATGTSSAGNRGKRCSAVLRRYHQWELEDVVMAPDDTQRGSGTRRGDALSGIAGNALDFFTPLFVRRGGHSGAGGRPDIAARAGASDQGSRGHFLGGLSEGEARALCMTITVGAVPQTSAYRHTNVHARTRASTHILSLYL